MGEAICQQLSWAGTQVNLDGAERQRSTSCWQRPTLLFIESHVGSSKMAYFDGAHE